MRKGQSQHFKYILICFQGGISATKKAGPAEVKKIENRKKIPMPFSQSQKAGVPGCKPEDFFIVHSINGEIFVLVQHKN